MSDVTAEEADTIMMRFKALTQSALPKVTDA